MYLTLKQQVKFSSKEDYRTIKKLCHIDKNLTNEAIYNVRQYYFSEKKYLNYYANWKLLKKNSMNYKKLRTHVAQQIIQYVDSMFRSFFALIRLKQAGEYSQPINIPYYLPKNGFTTLAILDFNLSNNRLTVPYSRNFGKTHKPVTVNTPPILKDKKVRIVKIVPKANARYFEIQYVYEAAEAQSELNKNNALGIDLGINNLAACVTNTRGTFIIDCRRLKSINQWYNKENSRLQSIKDKQKYKGVTKRQKAIARRRNNRVNDYIAKAVRIIINYCLIHDIGTLVCGYNAEFQMYSSMGKVTNQNFVHIPFGELRSKLKYLCEFYGIDYHEQKESYTSKASFWNRGYIPVYASGNQQRYKFSGSRTHRGLYKTASDYKLNADVN